MTKAARDLVRRLTNNLNANSVKFMLLANKVALTAGGSSAIDDGKGFQYSYIIIYMCVLSDNVLCFWWVDDDPSESEGDDEFDPEVADSDVAEDEEEDEEDSDEEEEDDDDDEDFFE